MAAAAREIWLCARLPEGHVRYNVRALGYVAVLGSGITVVDLNRFYGLKLEQPSPGTGAPEGYQPSA